MKGKLFYLLLARNSQENKKELESETFPYSFLSNGHRLRNYRIYGTDGGVGDYDSETGKYLIPVIIEKENLINDNKQAVYYGLNFSIVGNKVTLSGTPAAAGGRNTMCTNRIVLDAGTYIFSHTNSTVGCNIVNESNNNNLSNPFTLSETTNVHIGVFIPQSRINTEFDEIDDWRLEKGSEATVYSPTNIFLDEPLGEGEYIDFREQKRYPSGEMVSLPVIPTIDGTNILSVDTTMQPSKIWIQGSISETETVSAQSLQANIQDLQPLSLDDENLELDVMPVEIPVPLNEISETLGGVEDGE